MVESKRDFRTYGSAYLFDIFGQELNVPLAYLNAVKHVWREVNFLNGFARRQWEWAGYPLHQSLLNAHAQKVHLEKSKPALHPVLKAKPCVTGVIIHVCVRIDADAVAKLSAKQLVNRNVPILAGDIPQRHLNGTNSPGLPRMVTELFYFAKELIDAARILSYEPAF
jgi:hypothetical protein